MVVYNGKDLGDYGVMCIGRGVYNSPARDIEQIHIPGLNGDLLYDAGGYTNVDITYPDCYILEDFPTNIQGLRNFLLSSTGYHRLEDSYNPDEFRLAEFRGPLEAEGHTGRGNRSGRFDLKFNCMPQRFLKSGDYPITLPETVTNSIDLKNDWMPAEPFLIVRPGANATVKVIMESSINITITESEGVADMTYEIDMADGSVIKYRPNERSFNVFNGSPDVSGTYTPIPTGTCRAYCEGLGDSDAYVKVKPRWWRI